MSNLATQFTVIMAGLRAAVANHTDRRRVCAALYIALWNRVGRIATRVETLFARWQAGTLPQLRPPRPSRAGTPATPSPEPYIPRGRAWLVAVVGYHAAGHASQIQNLLSQPEFTEFLIAVPRAGRILRPLCHTLGIPAATFPALALPARPPRPRKPRPPTFRHENPYPVGFRRLGSGPMPVRRRHQKFSPA